MNRIELKQVSKTYGEGTANETKALVRLNLSIPHGEFTVIVGPNGSGKSTLLNVIAGATMADSGSLYINGTDVTRLREHQRSKWIARVFQNPLSGTASDLTVMDNFRLASLRTKSKGLKIGTDKKFRELVQEKISLLGLGLENKTMQPMGSLSGGQRQALTLVMAVMDQSVILLMDEPAAALDPKTSALIMELANKIINEFKLTALLVTHHMKDALHYGNRLLLMQEGLVVKDLDEVKKRSLTMGDLMSWF